MGFVNERLENHQRQTIDRERGIVLKRVEGGGPGNDYRFHLALPEGDVYFRAHQRFHQAEGHIEWFILQTYAPDHIKQDKARLRGLITEAMDAYGFSASKEDNDRVTVTFCSTFEPHISE
ncbi:MAG: hypothetical protein LZF61_08040 [Nitrosomonas sp.]|nr:MAG: hypothetical protein LZF61_08040 [Nitrosomonas sp.]